MIKYSTIRRNPLRLIVNKETQLRILWWVGGAVFFCMALTAGLIRLEMQRVWIGVVLTAVGIFVSLWVSRRIAGPLHRIEKDLESVLSGAAGSEHVHLRQGDPLQNLADLVNQLIDRSQKTAFPTIESSLNPRSVSPKNERN